MSKKTFFRDYAAQSEFFHDDNKILEEEMKNIEKSKKYVLWVQEFSKKIVIVTFSLYIITSIFSAIIVYLSFKAGFISGIDTLISETNNTFRDIIGGYIIKSAVENAIKIGGNYYIGIADAKLRIMKEKINPACSSQDSMNNNDDQNIVINEEY